MFADETDKLLWQIEDLSAALEAAQAGEAVALEALAHALWREGDLARMLREARDRWRALVRWVGTLCRFEPEWAASRIASLEAELIASKMAQPPVGVQLVGDGVERFGFLIQDAYAAGRVAGWADGAVAGAEVERERATAASWAGRDLVGTCDECRYLRADWTEHCAVSFLSLPRDRTCPNWRSR
jgi:hypothetical protein